MASRLLRTTTAIDECEQHLSETGAIGSPIESYLAQHIAVIMCADVQQAIYEIVETRAKRIADTVIQSYIDNSAPRILRSVKKGELATFIAYFGPDRKEAFNQKCRDDDVSLYNNTVEQRHRIAHHSGASISFRDLKLATDAAQRILTSFEQALS